MGKSNNRRDMHDYADDYDDYRAMDTDTATEMATDTAADMTPASTATKAKMSSRPMKLVGMGPGQRSQRAKQRTKRNNQTDR